MSVFVVYRYGDAETSGGGCATWQTIMAICTSKEELDKCLKSFKKRNIDENWGLFDYELKSKEVEANKLFWDVCEE